VVVMLKVPLPLSLWVATAFAAARGKLPQVDEGREVGKIGPGGEGRRPSEGLPRNHQPRRSTACPLHRAQAVFPLVNRLYPYPDASLIPKFPLGLHCVRSHGSIPS
jgi:hypothetical protein